MKQTRLKRAARILNVYRYNFGLSPPYAVLIDGTFAHSARDEQINLAEQLPKYLGAPVEIFTTKCCLAELERLGAPVYGALSISKLQMVAKCDHQPARSASACFTHLAKLAAKDGKKYLFATQDPRLTKSLRAMTGIPILYIAYKTVLLDPVSDETKTALEASKTDLGALITLKKTLLGEEKAKKKPKKKGVNPLSCKKKIAKVAVPTVASATKTASGKRRRRKKATTEQDNE